MADLDFQQLSTVQNNQQIPPVTFAAAATVAPRTFLSFVTGTTNVATITPFVTGTHVLLMQFTDASPGDILTTGNVLVGLTTVAQNDILMFIYNPLTAKYFVRSL